MNGYDTVVRDILKSNGVFEAHELLCEYKCFRKREDEETQEVMVRVWDMGPDHPEARYKWDVWAPDAECAEVLSSNASEHLLDAGHRVHWHMLDAASRKDAR